MDAKRVIVTLDVPSLEKAGPLIEMLAPHAACFKVGLELQTSVGGPQAVEFVQRFAGSVFYDGKFNDIPSTVACASRAVAAQGIRMFNVHA